MKTIFQIIPKSDNNSNCLDNNKKQDQDQPLSDKKHLR